MVVLNKLIEFIIDKQRWTSSDIRPKLQSLFENSFKQYGFSNVYSNIDEDISHFHFVNNQQSHVSLTFYKDGLISLNIEEMRSDDVCFKPEILRDLKVKVKELCVDVEYREIPDIKRGEPFQRYYPSSDDRILEYDFDDLVVNVDSPYQNVKIFHSPQYGNTLFLDDDPNLAESDIAYTRAITGEGKENYENKTVLVLGGGDGGILHELLKENPKHVYMVDIDEIVVTSAIKHLRGICGDSMDNLKGDNYEVVIADCVPILEKFVQDGKTFDYVINDLTQVPCSSEGDIGDEWLFFRKILNFCMDVMSPNGKYFHHGHGLRREDALQLYENELNNLKCPVGYRRYVADIPSYLERWVFFEVWKK